MSRGIAIDSDDELVTRVCRTYRDAHVYPKIAQAMQMTRLAGADATRAKVGALLGTGGVDLITGSGHGFPERFTGQGRDPILEIGSYAPVEVSGAIVHLLSCETAKELGADLVSNGCKAFFGYDETFVFPDEAARLFLEADSQIDLKLAEGATAEEAYRAAIRVFDRHIVRLLQAGQVFVAAALKRNRDHLCAPPKDPKWGDPAAKLE